MLRRTLIACDFLSRMFLLCSKWLFQTREQRKPMALRRAHVFHQLACKILVRDDSDVAQSFWPDFSLTFGRKRRPQPASIRLLASRTSSAISGGTSTMESTTLASIWPTSSEPIGNWP